MNYKKEDIGFFVDSFFPANERIVYALKVFDIPFIAGPTLSTPWNIISIVLCSSAIFS